MLVGSSQLLAQNDVIITPTDTIRNVTISIANGKTDSKKVVFSDIEGKENSLFATEVVGYYADNSLYKSINVNYPNGQIRHEFAQLIFNGDVDLYHSEIVDANGNRKDNYLMSKEDGTGVVSLIAHKNNLANFCSYYLPQYEAFKETESYKKSIREVKYSYNSLATFTSYYNHFINPKKFKATKYKKKIKVGHLVGIAFIGVVTVVSIKILDNSKENNKEVLQ